MPGPSVHSKLTGIFRPEAAARSRRAPAWGVWLLLVTIAAGPASAQEAWEYSPYRIQVWFAAAADPRLPAAVQQKITRTLTLRAAAVVAGPWRLQVDPAPPRLHHDINHALRQITFYELTGLPREDEKTKDENTTDGGNSTDGGVGPQESGGGSVLANDKIYLFGVDYQSNRYVIRVREFDCATRMWGRYVERRLAQRDLLAEAAFDALLAAFTPMVRIEDAEDKLAVTRLRAGNLTADPKNVTAIQVGDILQPVVRRNDRYGEPLKEGIELIPWTFLSVEQQDGSILECQIHSGLRRPVSGRSSVRTQRYGMLVRPTHDSTRLVLMSQDDPPKPLMGYDVYSKYPEPPEPAEDASAAPSSDDSASPGSEPAGEGAAGEGAENPGPSEDAGASEQPGSGTGDVPADSESGAESGSESKTEADSENDNPPVLLGRSDWRGIVEVTPGEHPVRLVYVKNGNRLLARLPIVPGLEPELTVELMNDDLRLQAEAFIAGVQAKIMDLVTRRAVLTARIRSRVDANKVAEAEELMTEFRSLETRRDLFGLLDQEAQRFVTNDRVTQRKIDVLFSDTRELINKYLTPESTDQLSQMIRAKQEPGS